MICWNDNIVMLIFRNCCMVRNRNLLINIACGPARTWVAVLRFIVLNRSRMLLQLSARRGRCQMQCLMKHYHALLRLAPMIACVATLQPVPVCFVDPPRWCLFISSHFSVVFALTFILRFTRSFVLPAGGVGEKWALGSSISISPECTRRRK